MNNKPLIVDIDEARAAINQAEENMRQATRAHREQMCKLAYMLATFWPDSALRRIAQQSAIPEIKDAIEDVLDRRKKDYIRSQDS